MIDPLLAPVFPRSSAYNPEWVIASASGGANSLWLTEWLTSAIELKPGMKVLDLGCGRACSSIFLAREFDVSVWATDLWFSPTENAQRIRDAGVAEKVFPIHSDARSLPFAGEFFDAIISIDAFPYFGTDDHFLPYLTRFVKPDGHVAIALAGFVNEFHDQIPPHLSTWVDEEPLLLSMHSTDWWRRHWEKSRIIDICTADSMPDGWKYWLQWLCTLAPENKLEINSIKADSGQYLGYNRIIARRRPDAVIAEPLLSIPSQYSPQPLLRETN